MKTTVSIPDDVFKRLDACARVATITPQFDRYIGIDYSGAEVATASLKGLRVYTADRFAAPAEVPPPPSPRKYWSRREIAEWLVDRLAEWLRTADLDGRLALALSPQLDSQERSAAEIEGWILGVE